MDGLLQLQRLKEVLAVFYKLEVGHLLGTDEVLVFCDSEREGLRRVAISAIGRRLDNLLGVLLVVLFGVWFHIQ